MNARRPALRLTAGILFGLLTMSCTSESSLEIVLEAKAILGEGALWHPVEKTLYWIDIEGRQLHMYDPATKKDRVIPVAERIGTVVPVSNGGALVALQNGIFQIDTESGALDFIVNPLPDSSIRFNDGKCDPSGRFWVGSMALDYAENAASLYVLDGQGKISEVLDSVTISNGIVWTADKRTMYYVDTTTGVVQGFDYDDGTGTITNRRIAIRIPEGMGSPDGMTIDVEDKLWVAMWGGSCVARFDPVSGELLEKIILPAPNVTSCAFGGEYLQTLYITTARDGLNEDQLRQFPSSGNVFAIDMNVKGVPANFYQPKQ